MTVKQTLENYQQQIEKKIEELTELCSIQIQLKSIVEESETKFIEKQIVIDSYKNRIDNISKQITVLKDTYNILSNLLSNYNQYQYVIDSMFIIFDVIGGLNNV